MTDMGSTIIPKSDQLNSDDLLVGPITIRVTKVSANPSSSEQPISIFFEGDNGKPWKPCKSMRRVLVQVWGRDGAEYVGRRMTLFRDPSVQWGGVAVGGIRISHMSDIDRSLSLMLTASRASRKPYTVEPLKPERGRASEPPQTSDEPAPLSERIATARKFLLGAKTVRIAESRWNLPQTVDLLPEMDAGARDELTEAHRELVHNLREEEGKNIT